MERTGIYLDHAATTPVRPEVRCAMEPYWTEQFSNPSSVYRRAQSARGAVERARDTVAGCLGAHPTEVVFTSGGTEANNAAIKGAALASRDRGRHVVTSAVEHHAVLHPIEDLEEMYGTRRTVVPVNAGGIVDPADVAAAIESDTVLISVMWANNEIGTIQPIAELSTLARERGIVIHTDAVQAAGSLVVDVREVPVDLLSISAHKFYGPKGVGALIVRRGTRWRPQTTGGAQERNRRAGTENVAGIVGMATALELAVNEREAEACRLRELRDLFIACLEREVPGTRLNGDREKRLSNNVNVSFDGVHGETLLLGLDREGVLASSGSACTSGSTEPSHVLRALGLTDRQASESVRFTLGRETTRAEVQHTIAVVKTLVGRMRGIGIRANA